VDSVRVVEVTIRTYERRDAAVDTPAYREFARLSRLSPKALRLYDELGLLQR
jgi:hypothetical protein